MKKFLFVTCLTPQSHTSDLRNDLHARYLKALSAQSNNNWQVYLLGEADKVDGNFHYIKCNGTKKEEKLLELFVKLEQLIVKPDFLIRLDDDDYISPGALDQVQQVENLYDVFTDKYQAMFDIVSGKTLSKIYDWWPSTIVMKYNDAVALQPQFDNRPLYACSHNLAFHTYFKKHNVFYSSKEAPIYTRIFSPTSITFSLFNGSFNEKKYEEYLNTFGFWYFQSNDRIEKLRSIYQPLTLNYFKKNYKYNFMHLRNIASAINFKINRSVKRIVNKLNKSKV